MLMGAPTEAVVAQTAAPPAAAIESSGTAWRWMLLLVSAVLVAFSLFTLLTRARVDDQWVVPAAVVVIAWLSVFALCAWRQVGHMYCLGAAYIVTLVVFHFSITLSVAFGWFDVADWRSGSNAAWAYRAAWAAILALGGFGIGYALAPARRPARTSTVDAQQARRRLHTVFTAGVGLLLASLVFLAIGIAQVGNPLQYARMDFFHGVGDMRGLAVFMMTMPSAATLLVIGAYDRPRMIAGASVAAATFLLFMLTGYRSAALFPLLTGIMLWRLTGRRLPAWLAGAALAGILIAIPAMSILRASGSYQDMSWGSVQQSFAQSDVREAFVEMGSTAGILSETMKLVPERDPYRYGMTYLRAVREAIPNVLPNMREWGRAAVISGGIGGADDLLTLPPSDWITYRIEPLKFQNGEGLGFSSIAEAYLNFGVPGILIVFAVLGYWVGRLDRIDLLRHPQLLIFCAAAFWPLLRTVRNDFDNFLKPLGFIYITLVIWFLIRRALFPRGAEAQA